MSGRRADLLTVRVISDVSWLSVSLLLHLLDFWLFAKLSTRWFLIISRVIRGLAASML